LNLYDNQVGSQGALHLANALQNNIVRAIFSLHHSNVFVQSLEILNLYNNSISDEGTEYIANALQMNRVSDDRLSIFSFLSFNIDTHNTQSWI